jgi:hypothetical protein
MHKAVGDLTPYVEPYVEVVHGTSLAKALQGVFWKLGDTEKEYQLALKGEGSVKRCPFVTKKGCSLPHDSKPLMCSLAPLAPSLAGPRFIYPESKCALVKKGKTEDGVMRLMGVTTAEADKIRNAIFSDLRVHDVALRLAVRKCFQSD